MTASTRAFKAEGVKDTKAAVSIDDAPSVLVLAANEDRRAALIQPLTTDLYLGDSSVTALTGIKVTAGSVFVDTYTKDDWYGITSAGTSDVRVLEVD